MNSTPPTISGNYWRTYWTDETGRRRSHSLGPIATTTEPQAKRLWRQWTRTDFLLSDGGVRPETVRQLVTQWLRWCRGYYRRPDGSDTGEAAACASAVRWLVRMFGNLTPGDLRPSHLEATQIQMQRDDIARTTINSYINRTRRFARWAVVRDWLPADVVTGWLAVPNLRRGRTPARETEGRTLIDYEIVRQTLDHLSDPYATLVQLLWCTGARPSELCGMRLEDIDRRSEPWTYAPERHKTQRTSERLIQFGPRSREHLDAMASGLAPGDWLGPCFDDRGTIVTQRLLRAAVRSACVAAGVEIWTPYQLRHAALSRIEREYGRTGAMSIAGHKAASTTDHYVDVQRENQQRGAAIAEHLG